jgi:hypothetical protein
MKIIGSLQGHVAYKEAREEYQPLHGATYNDIINAVVQRYGFQSFPRILPGMPISPIMTFASGKYNHEGMSFAIAQLIMTEGGDVVLANSTEAAEIVLDDLIKTLDERLGFRLQQAHKEKLIVSNVVVEFDRGLEDYIRKLEQIVELIGAPLKDKPPFRLKRLSFGVGDVVQFLPAPDPMPAMEGADFVLERRQGAKYEQNRYFSSAPMHTTDHLKVLERMEEIARS